MTRYATSALARARARLAEWGAYPGLRVKDLIHSLLSPVNDIPKTENNLTIARDPRSQGWLGSAVPDPAYVACGR
jgi:hypothetical protein